MKGIAERNGYRSPTTTPAFQTELLARSCYGGCANRRNATAPRYWRTALRRSTRSEEHTSELQSLMRISYAVFCLKKKKKTMERKQFTNMKKKPITNTTMSTAH